MKHLKRISTVCIYIYFSVNLLSHDITDKRSADNLHTIESTFFTCQDGIQNGDETGIDCGGTVCPACNGNGACGAAAEFPDISTSLSCDPDGVLLQLFYEGGGLGGYQYTVSTDQFTGPFQFTLPYPLPNIGDQLVGLIFSHPTSLGILGNFLNVSITGCDPNTLLYDEFILSIDCLPPCSDPMDYIALRALYLSTDGDNWFDNSGWPDATFFNANPTITSGINMSGWNGVVCENDRVRHLELPANNLVGTIPIEIGLLADNLHTLNLGDNNIAGTIPAELWDLTNLHYLGLQNSSLSGQLPPDIGDLLSLGVLLLNNNNLSGALPPEMKELSNLDWISLSFNSFSGTIDDDFFEKWIRIHDIRFDYNQFSGELPISLGDRSSLRVALLNDNQFTGCFPYNYKNLCTNRDFVPNSVFNFGGNVGLGTNDGDFEAFCNSEAGLCATTIDCHWIELTINTGIGPMFFKYNIRPFDSECNDGTIYSGEYYLNTDAPNTSLTYVHEVEENWFRLSIQNELYDGSDLTQTIEIKDHSTGNILVPQTSIESFFLSEYFPTCNTTLTNQNLTVSNNNDSGPGSLRQAIIASNCTYGKDEINILTTGTINLTSCNLEVNNGADCFIILPSINDDVCIIGNGITITSNTTGRLFNSGSSLMIKDLTIDNINYSTFQGGTGGAIWNGGDLNLENVTFSNNHTAGAGGAIYSFGDIDILNCTFSNNSSGDRGGAMVLKNGSCKINHSTFTDNTSTEGAAIYTWPNFPLEIENSIIANNHGDADLNLNAALVTNNTNLVGACVGDCPTFYSMADPQLGPLQDNGGVTYTHGFQAGAPGSVVTSTIQLSNLVTSGSEIINYTPNGCGTVTVSIVPNFVQYACAAGDDGLIGTADDGMCHASCFYVDDGNGTVTIVLNPSAGDPSGNGIPTTAICTVTVNVAQCSPSSPAIDALAIGSVLLDQRGYDIFNGEKDLGAYEYGGVDVDGCDIVEFETIDIMGNNEDISAHLMVGGDNTIDMNADVLYQASQLIDLKPGFEVVQGSVFEANIGPCN